MTWAMMPMSLPNQGRFFFLVQMVFCNDGHVQALNLPMSTMPL